tara:strand:- start:15265 stop:16140 length:876 start_codon:yes stop_codon:yes gene_type:complete
MILETYRNSLSIRNYQPASLLRNIQLAKRFLQDIEDIHAIDTEAVEDYLIALMQGGRSIKTVMNHRAAIKIFCDFLTSRGIIDENPVLRIRTMDMPEEVPVCLTEDEVLLAYDIARREDMLCEVTMALNTGLRMEELRRLKWVDVEIDRKQLIVKKAKGKRPRTVPLNQALRTALTQQNERFGSLEFVFPGGEIGGYLKSHWNQPTLRGLNWWSKRSIRCLQREIPTLMNLPTGRTGRGWHALRHTFATRAIKAGIDVVTLRDWMGHRKMETTLRYVHVARHYDDRIELLT